MKYLFIPNKLDYVKGKRPKVKCILCSVIKKDRRITPLVIHNGKYFIISMNLYPYNPGHLLLFPRRHLEDLRGLSQNERDELFALQVLSLNILEEHYAPHGFNIGCNLGAASGASLSHFHMHIVPRYHREKSFMDVIGGSRIFVEDPKKALTSLKKAFRKAVT